ncbi:DUF1654 domain-containing protein [Pseudomonas sp. NPDC090755]|uniref:DUF1654 domain-containing protein n=1 Tax=Pseudomonas sp. NPDC090755 TaxID=3364481 RepID=UPI00383AAF3F
MLPLAFSYSPSQSYERLCYRLQTLIASPHVQKRQYVDVRPAPEESEADWARLLDALEETNGIRIERFEPGVIRVAWREYVETL